MSWYVRFIVTKNSEDNRKQLVADVSHNVEMIFAFGNFTLIKMMNGRVFESSDKSCKPNSTTQVWRAAFR